jgi:uncharacterized repeat protein (TIGR04076 family)
MMKKWYLEDWRFKIEVLKVGKENKAEECRLGLEPGDTFDCSYETPAGFCPTSYIKIFPVMEVLQCGGDLRYLGANEPNMMDFICPDGAVWFRISGNKQE